MTNSGRLARAGLVAGLLAGLPAVFPASAAEPGTGAKPFAALHVYYLSPAGDDRNAGTSPAAAWATPRHDVACGDVIVAAPGRYVAGPEGSPFGAGKWGAVSHCPSTAGGIDGLGGVHFAVLLCAGPDLTSCVVDGRSVEPFRIDRSNWAVEGFQATQNDDTGTGCMTTTSETDDVIGFVAFINNIASNCGLYGFGSYGWTPNGGVDQSAVVGAIAYNASPSVGGTLCSSGVSMIPTNGPVATPGTRVFVAGNFAYRNINARSGAGCNSDGEGLVFDSWSCSQGRNAPYSGQGVAEQNAWWRNGSAGFEVFPDCQEKHGEKAQIVAFDNTSYGDSQDPMHDTENSELLLMGLAPDAAGGAVYRITNNIFVATETTCGNNGTCPVYAAAVIGPEADPDRVVVTGNYIFQSNPNVSWFATVVHKLGRFDLGGNIYRDPGLSNPDGLPDGPPDCAGYTNTTACMNERYHVAADLTPKVAVGYGYHPPGPCRPDPYYPSWLKGIVHLRWDGRALTEQAGLITKPCDL